MACLGKSSDAAAPPSRAGRALQIFVITFKWCRITLLLLILVVIVLGLFLNKVGLPVSFQQRLTDRARAQGWDLQFSRLRLLWYRGLVAEDLALSRTNAADGPHLFVHQAELKPSLKALVGRRFVLDGAKLSGGRVLWPMAETNSPTRTLVMENVRGELHFNPGDSWELRSLEAVVLGAKFRVRADLTNASFVRDWKFERRTDATAPAATAIGNRFLAGFQKFHFPTPPDVSGFLWCDASHPQSLTAALKVIVPGFESPWASGAEARLNATLTPPAASNDLARLELKATVLDARTPWGSGTNLELNLVLEPSLTHWVPTNAGLLLEVQSARTIWGGANQMVVNAHCAPVSTNAALRLTRVDLTASAPEGDWGSAQRVRMTGEFIHGSTNLLPGAAHAEIGLVAPRTRWTTSEWAHVDWNAELPAASCLALLATNVASWPDRLSNVTFRATAIASNTHAWRLVAETVRVTNRWEPPRLNTEFSAQGHGTEIAGAASADVQSRLVTFSTVGSLDPKRFRSLLDTNAGRWVGLLETAHPPQWRAVGRLTLPAWTNREPDWESDVLPSLSVSGQITAGPGAYAGTGYNSVEGLFSITNLVLHAPEIRITRPEGAAELDFTGDYRTGAFHCGLRSAINPKALDPLLRRVGNIDAFDLLEFGDPPRLNGLVMGNVRDWRQTAFEGDVALTNAAIRGQSVKVCLAHVHFTNNFITIRDPLVLREGERGMADGIGIRLGKPRLYLTNATGNLAPFAIAHAIGPLTYRDVAPYVFDIPPMGRVNGSVPLGKSDRTEDMIFEVNGGPFHWRQFRFDQIQGLVHWRGSNVTLTNVQGRWCGGLANGWLFVDTSPTNTDLLSFHANVQGANLHQIALDMKPGRTNRLEGLLSGEIRITRADVSDDRSWQGYGGVRLTNGLIWDIPVFGVFSPVLNAFIPGLGNSRARHAAANFGITNSVIHSRDGEIRATMVRMQFRGAVGFDERVDGRMEAELLRDVPALGFVISKVFWPVTKLFEYKVTGTLSDPRTEQQYVISRVLLFPFQPIKTLKELFKEAEGDQGGAPASPAPAPDKPATPR